MAIRFRHNGPHNLKIETQKEIPQKKETIKVLNRLNLKQKLNLELNGNISNYYSLQKC